MKEVQLQRSTKSLIGILQDNKKLHTYGNGLNLTKVFDEGTAIATLWKDNKDVVVRHISHIFADLNDSLNMSGKLSTGQVIELAQLFVDNCRIYKVEDIILFCRMIKHGEWKLYRLDIASIMECWREYDNWRTENSNDINSQHRQAYDDNRGEDQRESFKRARTEYLNEQEIKNRKL